MNNLLERLKKLADFYDFTVSQGKENDSGIFYYENGIRKKMEYKDLSNDSNIFFEKVDIELKKEEFDIKNKKSSLNKYDIKNLNYAA